MSDTPSTPDAPPGGAAGPRPGERKCEGCGTCGAVELVGIHVPNGLLTLCRQCLDAVNRKNPELKPLRSALAEIGEKARQALDLAADEDVDAALYLIMDAARLALAAVKETGHGR